MRALILTIALGILSALPAFAADVLILQSGRGPAYAEAVLGFREAYRGSTQTVVLADYVEVDAVRLVKEEKPRLVLAVGDPALAASKKLRQVPVVALLALSQLQRGPAGAVSGVAMAVEPERYLELCKSMGAKRVGVVHDPSRTGWYLQRARQAARAAGVELVVHEVSRAKETTAALEQLKGSVDALWMLPDTTSVTGDTIEAWFNFSISQQVPVLTFSEQYLKYGAVASIDLDRIDMGRQAGELATRLLQHNDHGPVAMAARKGQLHINGNVTQRLGLKLPLRN